MLAVTRLLLLWHSANRATRALGRFRIGDCLPFPLAGRPFHRFQVGALSVTNASSTSPTGRFVSAPLPTLSRCPFGELQFYTWAEFPQTHQFGSESHTPTRQPTHECTWAGNKNFDKALCKFTLSDEEYSAADFHLKGVTRFVGFQ